MADKTIGELPAASEVYDDSLLVMEQQGEARSVQGALIKKYAREATASYVEDAKKSAEEGKGYRDAAAESARDAADVALHPPILKEENDHWWIWDTDLNDYKDSGIDAGVSLEVVEEIITGEPGTPASVANLGTKTDPRLQFTLPQGEPGVSPTVDVVKDGGVTTVTITDAHGPHTATINDGDVSREALDAALAKKADRSDTDPIVAWHSNPNLLDNWYFVGGGSQQGGGQFPINQRGQTNYTAVGYSFDRWVIQWAGEDAKFMCSDEGISAKSVIVSQRLTEDQVRGKTVTFSVLTKDCGLSSVTYKIPISGTFDSPDSAFPIGGCIDIRVSAIGVIDFRMQLYNDITLIAAKLELGSQQTLAHKEGDTWVLNEIPNYQQELAKCQRYQVKFANDSTIGLIENSKVSALVYYQLTTPLAKNPTMIFENSDFGKIYTEAGEVQVENASVFTVTDHVVRVRVNCDLSECTIGSAVSSFTVAPLFDANL